METTTRLKKPEAMLFDMDGTLFQTETLLLPAYHKMFDRLRTEGIYTGETPPESLVLSTLGMILDDIWKTVLPDLDAEGRNRANEIMLELEVEGLQSGNTKLYPQVKETLQALKSQGVKLFVASNGVEHYVKGVAHAHDIYSLFDGVYSAGEYKTRTKVDLVHRLLTDHNIQSAWMVGDRSSDVEAGKKNGQTVIGCEYAGFGNHSELQGSDTIIHSFDQLLKLYEEAK
ncbi:HAD-IA family hydrolase [Paenibacillus sediminis]|uniref:HAD superfamily hydrolase (TIGR01549 family) n=1 Tax=Paenibacillus sediminis TaxID=664909 RepID=A0ABS4H5L9_9BACL|nr:HAD-IA family hydrolase [Paenibacillus sediminis]MBP1937828.1 HAD superfamily hydrolase (TIGR01549 family) [Paenibacillus sediminis]